MIQSKPTHTILRASFSILLAGSIFFVAACEDEASKPETESQVTQAPLGAENGKTSEDLSVTAPPPAPFAEDITEETQLDPDQVFEVVEDQPEPVGGMEAFYELVGQKLRYPEEARAAGIEGRVFIQFVVNEQGNVGEVKTVKGLGHGLDEAAEDMIRETKWEPGKQKGQAVKVRMIMPVMFKLSGD